MGKIKMGGLSRKRTVPRIVKKAKKVNTISKAPVANRHLFMTGKAMRTHFKKLGLQMRQNTDTTHIIDNQGNLCKIAGKGLDFQEARLDVAEPQVELEEVFQNLPEKKDFKLSITKLR